MLRFQLFLIRSGIFRLGKPFVSLLSKVSWFIKLAAWISRNKNIPLNDFPATPNYQKRYTLYQYLIDHIVRDQPATYLEMGVADGETFRWWLTHLPHPGSRFYGFDTFEGLPEDWGSNKKGSFSNRGIVPIFDDPRYQLYKGLFQETLPPFLANANLSSQIKIVLMDADLYSSTLFSLTSLAPHLRPGDLLIFDEFFAPQHEFRAWYDFQQAYTHIKLELIAVANNYTFTAFKVI
ncbi:MAG TPA: TylF/MycF/NovP-related O-methyltransferase [Puia sp.]